MEFNWIVVDENVILYVEISYAVVGLAINEDITNEGGAVKNDSFND